MKRSKEKRKTRFRIFLLLIFVILLITQLIVNSSNQLVAADVGNTVRFWPLSHWTTNFSDTLGWDSEPAYWDTIQFPDVNGDSKADICGRGELGVFCGVSSNTDFSSPANWQGNFGDPQGWNSHESYWATIQFPDVNGDGRSDICGRGGAGIYCGLSDGSAFSFPTIWSADFSDAGGWKSEPYYWATIRFPDLNGDGLADICGRASDGINCGLSDGQTFGDVTIWGSNFTNTNNWHIDPSFWKTIQFPDVNGDGKADVCGRGSGGIVCGISTGTTFASQRNWTTNYRDDTGWRISPAYWDTIQFPDIDGDGRDDICGRASGGMYCGLSIGIGFVQSEYWEDNFSDANGWNNHPAYWDTIQFPDVNGDGRDDVCGRDIEGLFCAIASGEHILTYSFANYSNWQEAFSDSNGWDIDPAYWDTIQLPDVNGDGWADVCGRESDGVVCAPAAINNPPQAENDNYVVMQGSVLTVDPAEGVLSNDSDMEGDMLTAVLGELSPANGTLVLNPDGAFTYTPNADFAGTDSFEYVVRDSKDGISNIAVVTIEITTIASTPTATPSPTPDPTVSPTPTSTAIPHSNFKIYLPLVVK